MTGEIEPTLVAVLSDIKMPRQPILMVTGYGDDERRRQAAKYGAAEFLAKTGRLGY
jgi:FixJ family two-component response regulator